MDKITLNEEVRLVFRGILWFKVVYASEINLFRSGKPSYVRNKEGERFNYEFLDDESKEIVDKIVELNKKYL
jgi:hypothetical protein